jgi:diguanylate cyclase (GGDEF)-like protein/PAS domain S-box-containing protein
VGSDRPAFKSQQWDRLPGGISREQITARSCELIIGGSLSSVGATLFASILLVAAMSAVVRAAVLVGWLCVVCANVAVRVLLARSWRRNPDRSPKSLLRYQSVYRSTIGVSGLLWGATTACFYIPGDAPHQLVLTLVLVGVSAVAMTTLAVDRRCVQSFLVMVVTPLALRYAVQPESLAYLQGGLLIFYMLFMMANADRVRRGLLENLRLELEAVEREQRLKQAQQVAQLGSFEWDLGSGTMRWSDEHFRLWGYEPGSLQPDRAAFASRVHPEDLEYVQQQVDEAVRKRQPYRCVHRLRWPDGTEHYIQARAEPVINPQGQVVQMIGTVQNITLQRVAEERIRHLAFYDPLTGLPNRHLLLERLQQALQRHQQDRRCGALIFIDLDNFKNLNDTHGHDQGDEFLRLVGRRILSAVRRSDTVARLGGDEFVVMLEDLQVDWTSAELQAARIGEQIRRAIQLPFALAGREFHSSSSIGIALFREMENSVDEMLKRADLAMYQAKASGRNAVCLFTPELEATASARSALEGDLRKALQNGEFSLHLQGQVDAQGRWTGAEALLRWQHPVRGAVSPAEMIPIAEESGLILTIGQWVLQSACELLVRWAGQPHLAGLTLAVNVSARQFGQPQFVEQVLATIHATGADPRRLKIELTESTVQHDIEEIIRKMGALKAHGIGFALDDFGQGYSSLSRLKRLPLEQLKIDQAFVREVTTDANDAAIVHMILSLGKTLGLRVVAEGVERPDQRDFLAAGGCHGYQGYLFARPLPAADFEARMLAAGRTAAPRSEIGVLNVG